MSFFESLPKVNKLMVMRQALLEKNEKMFASMALRCITQGHLTMHDLSAAFGRDMDNPDFNPKMCTP